MLATAAPCQYIVTAAMRRITVLCPHHCIVCRRVPSVGVRRRRLQLRCVQDGRTYDGALPIVLDYVCISAIVRALWISLH